MPCPAGRYSDAYGATSVGACSNCVAGSWCPLGSQDTLRQCPRGYVCPEGSGAPAPCPPGTYGGDRTGLYDSSQCFPCPAGAVCYISGDPQPTLCAPGTFNPDTAQNSPTACVPCDAGWACPLYGTAVVVQRCRCASLSQSIAQRCWVCACGWLCFGWGGVGWGVTLRAACFTSCHAVCVAWVCMVSCMCLTPQFLAWMRVACAVRGTSARRAPRTHWRTRAPPAVSVTATTRYRRCSARRVRLESRVCWAPAAPAPRLHALLVSLGCCTTVRVGEMGNGACSSAPRVLLALSVVGVCFCCRLLLPSRHGHAVEVPMSWRSLFAANEPRREFRVHAVSRWALLRGRPARHLGCLHSRLRVSCGDGVADDRAVRCGHLLVADEPDARRAVSAVSARAILPHGVDGAGGVPQRHLLQRHEHAVCGLGDVADGVSCVHALPRRLLVCKCCSRAGAMRRWSLQRRRRELVHGVRCGALLPHQLDDAGVHVRCGAVSQRPVLSPGPRRVPGAGTPRVSRCALLPVGNVRPRALLRREVQPRHGCWRRVCVPSLPCGLLLQRVVVAADGLVCAGALLRGGVRGADADAVSVQVLPRTAGCTVADGLRTVPRGLFLW